MIEIVAIIILSILTSVVIYPIIIIEEVLGFIGIVVYVFLIIGILYFIGGNKNAK